MFEIGRELRRLFAYSPPRDGLCLGDPTLLELLDLRLLKDEARAADVAAGRITTKDRARALLRAAAVWREVARRTGDPAPLRKAASCAERAGEDLRAQGRASDVALCEQAEIALLGAELFAEDSLNAAADHLTSRAVATPAVRALQARLQARRALARGDAETVRAAAALLDRILATATGKRPADALARAALICDRAELLIAAASRLHDVALTDEALADLAKASRDLDGAYQPVTVARVEELRGAALVRKGELTGDCAPILQGIEAFVSALELISEDHAPLDWARLNHGQGVALTALGEAGRNDRALGRALQAFGRARQVLDGRPSLALRTILAQDRAACLVRRAELKGDSFALDEAEAALRSELSGLRAAADPVAWAVLQLSLARLYLARLRTQGGAGQQAMRAGEALAAAREVFIEKGLKALAEAAEAGLDQLREARAAQ